MKRVKAKDSTPWIKPVGTGSTFTLTCSKCGETLCISLPSDIDVYAKQIKTFQKEHKHDC